MRVLLTGSDGYIASSILKNINNLNYLTLSRKQLDLTDSVSVTNFFNNVDYFDAVIHTAIVGGSRLKQDTSQVLDKNLSMYYNLLKHENKFRKFISFGSGAELYADNTFYGLSKKVIHESMLDKPNFYNIRIFALFDENELTTRFIKANIKRYINKKPIEIHENKSMDFFYMEDFIDLIKHYLNNDKIQKVVNCSYEKKYSLLDIANIINNLDNHKVQIKTDNKNTRDYIGDFNLPIKYVGLEEGIKKTYHQLLKQL